LEHPPNAPENAGIPASELRFYVESTG
jgi:hypothetical protein